MGLIPREVNGFLFHVKETMFWMLRGDVLEGEKKEYLLRMDLRSLDLRGTVECHCTFLRF